MNRTVLANPLAWHAKLISSSIKETNWIIGTIRNREELPNFLSFSTKLVNNIKLKGKCKQQVARNIYRRWTYFFSREKMNISYYQTIGVHASRMKSTKGDDAPTTKSLDNLASTHRSTSILSPTKTASIVAGVLTMNSTHLALSCENCAALLKPKLSLPCGHWCHQRACPRKSEISLSLSSPYQSAAASRCCAIVVTASSCWSSSGTVSV